MKNHEVMEVQTDGIEWLYAPDMKYCEYDGVSRSLQLIFPYKWNWEENKRYPLVIFIPGSAWHRQEMYNNIPKRSELAKRGYVVAEVQYRESELAHFPAQVIDVKNAIRFLGGAAEQFHIDMENIFIAGDSSGGHIGLLAGLTAAYGELDEIRKSDLEGTDGADHHKAASRDFLQNIRGIITYSAPTNLFLSEGTGPVEALLGVQNVNENPDLTACASCQTYISETRKIPPVLMFHGQEDPIVSIENAEYLYETLDQYDKNVTYYEVAEGGHGGAVYWTEEILDIVENFMKQHLA